MEIGRFFRMLAFMALPPGSIIGHYKIIGTIGSGGMGEVYRALDLQLQREVALKLLPEQATKREDSVARFHREARAVAALSHPNILAIYDLGTDGNHTYAVTELLKGSTLRTVLQKGPLPYSKILNYAIQIALGLSAAHEKQIIHRDLKPENLFITEDEQIKILDFGLATILMEDYSSPDSAAPTTFKTEEGSLLGTVPYMSPEQAEGNALNPSSDIFSLGVVLYEMSTGKNPFLSNTAAGILTAILRKTPTPVHQVNPELPPEWGTVVERCLVKDASVRYAAAKDLRKELERFQNVPSTDKTQGRSIAVLPFTDMSQSKDQEYFCDGMSEELINALVKIPDLKVASRISSFQFKNQAIDIREVGRRLGVNSVLEGSVRKSGERLRITAQLINIADGYHLWSERYDRQLLDVFEIQEEIARSIVDALSVKLAPGGDRALKKQRANLEAYEFYLKGRSYMRKESRKSTEFAVEMFSSAIRIDPNYAPAYAGLADVSCSLYFYWDRSDANLQRADEASRKALDLAPDLAEAHASRAYSLSLKELFAEAEVEFLEAIRLDPRLFEAHYSRARACWAAGSLEKAASSFEKAAEIRPEDHRTFSLVSSIYAGMGKPDLAKAAHLRALEILEPYVALHPDDVRAIYHGATAYGYLGMRDRAIEWGRKAIAIDPTDPATLYNVACLYCNLGELEPALDALQGAVENGFAHRRWIENDMDLNPVRDLPRFKEILNKLPK